MRSLLVHLLVCAAFIALGPSLAQAAADQAEQPVTVGEALRHWDGTSVLFLARDREPLSAVDWGNVTAGVAFAAQGGSAADDCFRGVMQVRFAEGMIQFNSVRSGIRTSTYALSQGAPPNGIGEMMITAGRCRYVVRLGAELSKDGRWQAVTSATPLICERLPPPFPTDVAGQPRASVGTVSPQPPRRLPAELDVDFGQFALGTNLPRSERDGCPRAVGLADFRADGLFFDIPWHGDNDVVVGILRRPEQAMTRLIFQTPTCRLDLDVGREIRTDDGAWQPAPLASPSDPPS